MSSVAHPVMVVRGEMVLNSSVGLMKKCERPPGIKLFAAKMRVGLSLA